MTSSNRHLVIPWLLLISLTTISYLAGAIPQKVGGLSHFIPLATAAVKFGLVAWYFMELREVSRLWALGLGALLSIILITFIYLLSRTEAFG